MSETSEIVTPILSALSGLPYVLVHRLHAGTVKVRGGYMRQNEPGTPDVLAIVHGAPLYLECKTAKGMVTEEQLNWHARARRCGCEVVVVRSVADAMRVVQARLRKGAA